MSKPLLIEWRHSGGWTALPILILMQAITMCGVEIPVGTRSDGASVPLLLRWLFSPIDRYLPAVFLHDHLLATLPKNQRRIADDYFARALRECRVPRWRRWLMVAAVRLRTAWVNR